MPSDEELIEAWEHIENICLRAPTDLAFTDKGVEFKNDAGDTVFILPVAGTY